MKPLALLAAALISALPAAGLAQAGADPFGTDPFGADPFAAAPDSAIAIDRAYLIGRWTDTGDCGDSVEFDPDGRFTAADGGEGVWTLDGDALTLSGTATLTVTLVPIDEDTIDVIGADGDHGRSIRCQGGGRSLAPDIVA